MKHTILLLAAVFISTTSFANSQLPPEYYSAQFRITNISPMCPSTIPGGAQCAGLGSIVTAEAMIGCADKLVYSKFDERANNYGTVTVYATSLVKNVGSNIRCFAPQIIRKTFSVFSLGKIKLVNVEVQPN